MAAPKPMATINFSKVKKTTKLAELYGFSDMYKARYTVRSDFEAEEPDPVINEWGEYSP